MHHIPVGEIASQLPMLIDPTMIVDNALAGYWDAADALGNSPYVGDPDGLWERKRDGAAHGRLHRRRPPQPRPRLLGAQRPPPAPSSASSSAASTSPSASSRSPRHARATSPSESGDQRDTHGSYGARVRLSAPMPTTTSALRRRERCTMPRRRTPMCRAPMCRPRT
jgi:hypothetical protein